MGARGSQLSVAQANWVINHLLDNHPDIIFEFVAVRTGGDRDQRTALSALGGTGVFVKELERALSRMEIDLAVHSAKDLPSSLPEELNIVAVPPRAPVEDDREVLALYRDGVVVHHDVKRTARRDRGQGRQHRRGA